jgi:hypothetical protein
MRLFEFENEKTTMPEHVAQAFYDLGDEQRGLPESTMLKAQYLLGGGVLSFTLEHVGDIIHRMTHHAKYNSFYPGIVREKTKKTLSVLTNGYGFLREHEENMKASASYFAEKDPNFNEQEWRAKVDAVLKQYSAEHAKLVPYNHTQRVAIRASVLLGELRIDSCVKMLQILARLAANDEAFDAAASEYQLDDSGKLLPYKS